MPGKFMNLRFHKNETEQSKTRRVRTVRGGGVTPQSAHPKFHNDESAARYYLDTILEQDSRPVVRGLREKERPEVVPSFRFLRAKESSLTKTRVVEFDQVRDKIPIFGSKAVVEIKGAERDLISLDAEVAKVEGVSSRENISASEAIKLIAQKCEADPEKLSYDTAQLVFYHEDSKDRWHLAWFFKKVPCAPREFTDSVSNNIFGVIIKNFQKNGKNSNPAAWDWEIGSGLGENGRPLRDMSNPKKTKDPDHMNDYLKTTSDYGGVHTNSNIHNKAAYNLLIAVDHQGQPVISSEDIAVLYYLCLTRLNSLATFSKVLQVLLEVAKTYFAGDPDLNTKLQQIKKAYNKVGIK